MNRIIKHLNNRGRHCECRCSEARAYIASFVSIAERIEQVAGDCLGDLLSFQPPTVGNFIEEGDRGCAILSSTVWVPDDLTLAEMRAELVTMLRERAVALSTAADKLEASL